LLQVADGGVVRVSPGRYHETLEITRDVTIIGESGDLPIIEGLILRQNVAAIVQNIRIQASGSLSAVVVEAGILSLDHSPILLTDPSGGGRERTSALYASGGRVEIEEGTISSSGDAAVIVSSGAHVTLHKVVVAGGDGSGIYAVDGAQVNATGSRVTGRSAVVAEGRAELALNDTDVTAAAGQPVLSFGGNASATLVGNRAWRSVRGRITAAEHGWLAAGPGVNLVRLCGNRAGTGKRLRPTRGCHAET
jgi:hypothetical protein